MKLRIITINDAGDPEIGFLTKSISKPYDRATAMPTAWELKRLHHADAAWSVEKTSDPHSSAWWAHEG